MCNLSLGVLEQGIKSAKIEDITNVMKNCQFTLLQALKALNIPEEEYSEYTRIILDNE